MNRYKIQRQLQKAFSGRGPVKSLTFPSDSRIIFKTKVIPIVADGITHKLGPYTVEIDLEWREVKLLTDNDYDGYDYVGTHPHDDGGGMCMGNGTHLFKTLLDERKFEEAIQLLLVHMRTWTPSDDMVPLWVWGGVAPMDFMTDRFCDEYWPIPLHRIPKMNGSIVFPKLRSDPNDVEVEHFTLLGDVSEEVYSGGDTAFIRFVRNTKARRATAEVFDRKTPGGPLKAWKRFCMGAEAWGETWTSRRAYI